MAAIKRPSVYDLRLAAMWLGDNEGNTEPGEEGEVCHRVGAWLEQLADEHEAQDLIKACAKQAKVNLVRAREHLEAKGALLTRPTRIAPHLRGKS